MKISSWFALVTTVLAANSGYGAPSGLSAPAASAVVAGGGTMKLSFELSPVGSFVANDVVVSGAASIQGGKMLPPQKIAVDMTKLTTGISLRDQHLQKKLDTAHYPVATLTAIQVTSPGHAKGTLTFHGKTNSVAFDYTATLDKVKATFKLKISDWGVTEGLSYMGVSVEDDVDAEVQIPVTGAKGH